MNTTLLLKLSVLIGSLSAIQPFCHPLTFNFPWSLGYVRVSMGKLFHSQFCVQPTYGAQEYQTDKDTALSGYQFTPWSSGASEINFLGPEKFTIQWHMTKYVMFIKYLVWSISVHQNYLIKSRHVYVTQCKQIISLYYLYHILWN